MNAVEIYKASYTDWFKKEVKEEEGILAAILMNSSNPPSLRIPSIADVRDSYFCQAEVFQSKVVIISPNAPINSFRQPSTPSLFHCSVSGLDLKGRLFFLSLGNLEVLVGLKRLCLQVRKNTFCIHTQKKKKTQEGQAESFENVALHLFTLFSWIFDEDRFLLMCCPLK